MTEDELITIKSFSQSYEAEIARGRLESAGMWAVVADAHMINMNWFYSDALGGVKLQVRRRDAAEALKILSEHAEPEIVDGEPVKCEDCGSERLEFSSDKRVNLWTWLLLGIPLLRARAYRHCLDCGKKQKV